jgi:hypothetical protein
MAKQLTPEQLAACGSEDGHQMALFQWASMNVGRWPQLARMFHIQNASTNKSARVMGVKAGVPDIMLPCICSRMMGNHRVVLSGLFIELKRPAAKDKAIGRISADQDDCQTYLNNAGYRAVTCYGWQEARDAIVAYLSQ